MAETDHKTLYESLFSTSRDAIIFFNGAMIINANQAALDLFEVTSDEFIGHQIYEFTKDKEDCRRRIERRLRGESEFYTGTIETRSGKKEIEVSSTAVSIQNITCYCIIRDITERKQLVEKYQTVIERSADLIFVTNESGVVFVNPKGLEYLGRTAEEVIGKSTLNLIHPDYWETASSYSAERRAGGNPPSQYPLKLLRKDGKELEVELHASYIVWDGVPSSLTICRDISKQIEYDMKLEELHRTAAELNTLKDIKEIAETVVGAAERILGYQRFAFGVLKNNQLHMLAGKPEISVGVIPLEGMGITTRAIRTGKPQIVDDVRKDPDFIDPTRQEWNLPYPSTPSPSK